MITVDTDNISVDTDERDWAKSMVQSVIAYTPGGEDDDPEHILDSYSGRTYLTKCVEMFGREYMLNLIAQEQDRIEYIGPANDDGYVTVHYKNNEQWRYAHDKNNS